MNCEDGDADGNVLGNGKGMSDTTWTGNSSGMDATCVVEFGSDDSSECPVDDGNGRCILPRMALAMSRRTANRLVVDETCISCYLPVALYLRGGTFASIFITDCARSWI
jgi:hypothetical protein